MSSCSAITPGVKPPLPATTKALKARKRWACAKAAKDLTACVSVIRGRGEIDTSIFQLYLKYGSIAKIFDF
jgi:hypothetical protein